MHIDARIAARAAAQHGLVTYDQLMDFGLTRSALLRRTRSGRLERLEPRVYRVGGAPGTRSQRFMQALLGAGPGACLSHGTAARLHELDGFGDYEVIELSVPRGRHYRRVRVHERRVLASVDLITLDGLVVTRPLRTLLDLAAAFPTTVVERAYESALRQGLLVDRVVRAALVASTPGVVALRTILERRSGAPVTESDLETRFVQLVRAAGLPEPRRQLWIGRHRIDVAWPEHGVAVELDGRIHDGHAAKRRDDRRQNALVLGTAWLLLRYTWEDVVGEPARVVTEVAGALAQGSLRHGVAPGATRYRTARGPA